MTDNGGAYRSLADALRSQLGERKLEGSCGPWPGFVEHLTSSALLRAGWQLHHELVWVKDERQGGWSSTRPGASRRSTGLRSDCPLPVPQYCPPTHVPSSARTRRSAINHVPSLERVMVVSH